MQLVRFLAYLGLIILIPAAAAAQTTLAGTDLNISSTLQVGDDNSPVIDQETTLRLTVADENDQFRFENCDCNLLITVNGKTDTVDLQSTQSRLSQQYTFSQAGAAKATFSGKPIGVAVFQPFSITFPPFSVATQSHFSSPKLNNLSRLAVVGVLAGVFVIFFIAPYIFYARYDSGRKPKKRLVKKKR